MPRSRRFSIGWLAAVLVALAPLTVVDARAGEPAPATAGDPLTQHLPVLTGTRHIAHHSPMLGRTLHLFIRQPDLSTEEPGPAKRYPVIYLLDGDQTYPLIAAYHFYLQFAGEAPPATLVGIAYGTIDPAVNMRTTDLTAPAEGNAQYGGADRFLAALEQEIFPLVEGDMVDRERRVLVGQSLGGQFVLHAALRRPGLFQLGIAVNPALHRNLAAFTEALAKPAPVSRPSWLYMSSADNDDSALPWTLKAETLSDETHLSSLPRAYRNALRWRAGPAPAGE